MEFHENRGYIQLGAQSGHRLSLLNPALPPQGGNLFPVIASLLIGTIFSAVYGEIKPFFMKTKFVEHEVKGRMTGRDKKILSVLDDLIRINIDRITGYEKAAHEENTPDPEWRAIFYRMATDSRSYVNNLHAEVIHLGGAPVTRTTISGKIYLHWLDGKSSFEGMDIPSRRAACSAAEMAVQKAYHQALDEPGVPPAIYQLVENQLWALERAHQVFLTHA
jgi:uncharacterized protein (TIGR02284 family)